MVTVRAVSYPVTAVYVLLPTAAMFFLVTYVVFNRLSAASNHDIFFIKCAFVNKAQLGRRCIQCAKMSGNFLRTQRLLFHCLAPLLKQIINAKIRHRLRFCRGSFTLSQ